MGSACLPVCTYAISCGVCIVCGGLSGGVAVLCLSFPSGPLPPCIIQPENSQPDRQTDRETDRHVCMYVGRALLPGRQRDRQDRYKLAKVARHGERESTHT